MTAEELCKWHEGEAEKWSQVILREPETSPRSPAVAKEYRGFLGFHEAAVEFLKSFQGEES